MHLPRINQKLLSGRMIPGDELEKSGLEQEPAVTLVLIRIDQAKKLPSGQEGDGIDLDELRHDFDELRTLRFLILELSNQPFEKHRRAARVSQSALQRGEGPRVIDRLRVHSIQLLGRPPRSFEISHRFHPVAVKSQEAGGFSPVPTQSGFLNQPLRDFWSLDLELEDSSKKLDRLRLAVIRHPSGVLGEGTEVLASLVLVPRLKVKLHQSAANFGRVFPRDE